MPLLNLGSDKIAILREILAAWPKLKAALPQILAGPVSKLVAEQKAEAPPPAGTDGGFWFQIASASSVATGQWNYKGRIMKPGHASSLTGLVMTTSATEYDLRNAFETLSLGGLTDVTALKVIATGSIVYARPSLRNNLRVFVFERVNDVEC